MDVLPSRCSSLPEHQPESRPGTACREAAGAAELAEHARIRRAVFVVEQQLFDDDRDAHDSDPATVHLLGFVRGEPAGTVRLYPLGDPSDPERVWKGDRLAVLPPYRSARLGGPLVRLAVATAAARGAVRMVAHVQAANTAFFLGLDWAADGEPHDHLGLAHRWMSIPCRPAR